MTDLGEFEGSPVLGSAIAVRKAGDGLSEALKLDPIVLHQREKVYVVLECEVGPIKFVPVKDTDGVRRVQDLIAGTATIMDAPVVKEAIEAQADRIQHAKDQAAGKATFDDGLLVLDHQEGKHADGLVEFCALCDDEAAKVAAEAAAAK